VAAGVAPTMVAAMSKHPAATGATSTTATMSGG
jgi:hypothetical protein